ncbi:ABC transporter substrate-binding protein [Corticicoccus populi]|uniref:ABC transporter substrate-binding protein n=1 Tax=Corticicoccus populi TaxID=1812821 RepID=A0ABW5WVM0_9STAP
MNKILNAAVLVMVIHILAACTSDSEVEDDVSGSLEQGNDIVVSYADDAVSLDPHGSNDAYSNRVRSNIYEGLVKQGDNLETEPLLATDWEQIDDLTWEFTLDENVTFHDGTDFNAETVKANLERVIDPAVASPRANIYEMIEAVNVLDEHKIEIVTEYPFTPLLNYLTHGAGGMISKDLIDRDYQNAIDEAGLDMTLEAYYEERAEDSSEYQEAAEALSESTGDLIEQEAIGTNYLQFSDREQGEYTTLSRFEDYREGPATVDTVTFKVIPEAGILLADLEAGESHMIGFSEESQLERLENNPDIYIENREQLFTEHVGFNTQKEPLNDKRVRQAIAYLFNKEEIIDGVYSGNGNVINGFMNEQIQGYNDDIYTYDYNVERAKELMAEAGYEDGFELSFVTNEMQQRVDLGVYLQEVLSEINIDLSVEQLEWGTFLSHADSGEHDMFVMGWPNPTADPDQSLWPLYHSSMHGTQGNRTFFENEGVDSLLEEARQESDDSRRTVLYEEAQEILNEEIPAIHFRDGMGYQGIQNSVEGIEFDAHVNPDFRNVTIN